MNTVDFEYSLIKEAFWADSLCTHWQYMSWYWCFSLAYWATVLVFKGLQVRFEDLTSCIDSTDISFFWGGYPTLAEAGESYSELSSFLKTHPINQPIKRQKNVMAHVVNIKSCFGPDYSEKCYHPASQSLASFRPVDSFFLWTSGYKDNLISAHRRWQIETSSKTVSKEELQSSLLLPVW